MTDDDFERYVEELRQKEDADALQAYGEKGFARWKNPKYYQKLKREDGWASITGECGDTMIIAIMTEHDRIVDASYATSGCGSSAICGSFAAELAIGRHLAEAFDLDGRDILNAVGKLPASEQHCAYLAVNTLHEAVQDCLRKNKCVGNASA